MKTRFYLPITILSLSTFISSCALASLQDLPEEKVAAKAVSHYLEQAVALTKMTPQKYVELTATIHEDRLNRAYADLTQKKEAQIMEQQRVFFEQTLSAVQALKAYELTPDDVTTLREGRSLVLNNKIVEFSDAVVTITPNQLSTLQEIMPYAPTDVKGHRIKLDLEVLIAAENSSIDASGVFVVRPCASHKMGSKVTGKMLRSVLPESYHATDKLIPIAIKVTFPSIHTRVDELQQSFDTFRTGLEVSKGRLTQKFQAQTAQELSTKDFADWAYGKKCEKLLAKIASVEDTDILFNSTDLDGKMLVSGINSKRVEKAAVVTNLKRELAEGSSVLSFQSSVLMEAFDQDQKFAAFEKIRSARKGLRQALNKLDTL